MHDEQRNSVGALCFVFVFDCVKLEILFLKIILGLTLRYVHHSYRATADNIAHQIIFQIIIGQPTEYGNYTSNYFAQLHIGQAITEGWTLHFGLAIFQIIVKLLLLIVWPFDFQ